MSLRNPFALLTACLAVALVVGSSTPAKAIQITVNSAVNNTAVSLTGGGSGDRAQGNQLITTNSGTNTGTDVLNATATAATRFIATVAADRAAAFSGGTAQAQDSVNYTVTFSVNPSSLTSMYNINVNTNILGANTAVDDASGLSNGGNAVMTNVSGFLNNVSNPSLNLASASSQGGTSSSAVTQFSASNLLSLGPFTGPQNFSLRFTWTMTANSPQAVNGGDEMAVRLGFNNPLGGASADDYPGPGSRNINSDGHFVNISATLISVPEPSTVALACFGAIGLVMAGLRRRRVA